MACCRKYLKKSGVRNVLVENEIYGPNTVMSGSHYVRGKGRMSMTAEALGHLQLSAFFSQTEFDRYKPLFDTITETQSMFEADDSDQEILQHTWERCENEITHLNMKLDQFKQGCEKSSTVRYWNTFINDVAPVLRDLTGSFCEGDWDLHLSAIQRALPYMNHL